MKCVNIAFKLIQFLEVFYLEYRINCTACAHSGLDMLYNLDIAYSHRKN